MAEKPNNIFSFSNRHVSADGSTTEHLLQEEHGTFRYSVITDDVTSTNVLEAPDMDYAQALASEPGLLLVGTGYTDITYIGHLSLHDLLGLLVVDDPEGDAPDLEEWADEDGEARFGVDLDELGSGDEEMMSMSAPDGFDIVPRWVTINGERGFVLRGEGFAAIALVDPESDWNKPMLTDKILSWRFYNESGGLCSWDGGAELGWCGRRLWTLRRWGDEDPVMEVFPAPGDDEVAGEVTKLMLGEDWELPFLLAAVGMPGLSDEDREALRSVRRVGADEVSSFLSEELNQQIVGMLCTSYPHLNEAVHGLRNPDSECGQAIYGWLQEITHGTDQLGSWENVYAAMVGDIGTPADCKLAREKVCAAREAYEALTEHVHHALNPRFDAARLHALRARLAYVDERRQSAAESRAFLRFEEDGPGLLDLAEDRIAENPDDDTWVANVWSAYWSAQRAFTSEEESELRAQLDEEARVQEDFTDQLARASKDAESAGWPSTWPYALHRIWTEHGGTVASANAWARAGHDPIDIILGYQPTASTVDNLVDRLRNETPRQKGNENGCMTEEEAELRLAERWRDVETGWNSLVSTAMDIAVGRGFQGSSVAFEGYLADGERYCIKRDEFLCIPNAGAEFTISPGDSVGPLEDDRWRELEVAAQDLETIVPPVVEGRINSFDDLKGYEDDVRMVLFADFDDDGNFQYDDKGMKSIISGVWL